MKYFAIAFLIISFSSGSFAQHTIQVTEPNFTADKIELNPVTNSYVVVNPRYYLNATTPLKVSYKHTGALTHLCTFLGMSGGKSISTSYGCINTIMIGGDGQYGSSYGSQCWTIDFLECDPK